jgi:GR25 family glycosyltransferase involved in LPS biosynthesis
MIIDLREIPVVWINLDSATKNAEIMKQRFEKYEFKNTHRKSGLVIPSPPNTDISIAHYRGCGQSHIDILEDIRYSSPLLVLEDDIEFMENFNPIIEIPDDSDGVYLGISHGNMHYNTNQLHENYLRIGGILAAHAILYVTPLFRQQMAAVGRHCLYTLDKPWDIGTAAIQYQYKVYTPNVPLIYQSNDRDSANKWQSLTDKPLHNRNFIFQ